MYSIWYIGCDSTEHGGQRLEQRSCFPWFHKVLDYVNTEISRQNYLNYFSLLLVQDSKLYNTQILNKITHFPLLTQGFRL